MKKVSFTESSSPHSRWMSVNNAMTKDVISVKGQSKVRDAWLVLMEQDISGAPVVDESGTLVGVLSVTDIYRSIVDRIQKARSLREATIAATDPGAEDKEELRELSLAIRAVAEATVMSILPKDQKVFSLSPEDSLDRAIRLIAEHSVNRLPIVKDGKVVGIITRQDIIWIMAGRPG
ncbi:MAG TPA: CBS domain-containing protein [Thermoplasmata archaeon]